MKLYKKFLQRIENGKINYDNEQLAKDLEEIAKKYFKSKINE